MLITAVVVLFTLLALVKEWAAAPLVVFGATVTLLVSGVITPSEALAGFSNPAPITIAALFIIARAVERTGALRPLLERALVPGGSERGGATRSTSASRSST